MGKKVKKDEKGPPDDVFDPLLVESRQAKTVVLMLESPEEEVLTKACEAIYKFVDKSDENKKALLDLNAHLLLFKLLTHEEKTVRRNATMAIGVIASHPDARKALRRENNFIKTVINLLSPEEDTVTHEFAALTLSSLAHDYSSKVMIDENKDGIESLVRCLQSTDPDVQKNSIETINLCLDHFHARTTLREKDGFIHIMELTTSEYPVIQHLALSACIKAAEEGANRAVLRDMEAINKMIEYVGRPDLSDLHVFAIMVISNCLEDTESMEQIKENGGLAKLLAFIVDAPPPEEEDTKSKGAKGKEKGGSRAGKKGKDEGGGKKGKGKKGAADHDDEKDHVRPIDAVIATLPEVKEHAARAIGRAAKIPPNRNLLHEQQAEKMLILLLAHENAQVQVASAQALAVISENLVCRDSIGRWDGIEPLIKMSKNDNADVREAASLALANLTTSNMTNCQDVARFHGIDPLVALLADSRELTVANAAITLTNMAPDEHLRTLICNAGMMSACVEPLCSTNTQVQSKVALAIGAFVCDCEARTAFRENGGIPPLVALLRSNDSDVRRSVSWAVTVCTVDEPTSIEVIKCEGLEILQEIELSDSRKNAFSDVAIGRILDNHLAAKYALRGHLSSHNFITDGFFDVGQLQPGSKLQQLEDYCKAEVDQKRAVLLINAKPEKPQTPAPSTSEPTVTDKSSKSSSVQTGRNSRTGRGDKTKRRDKEKEKLEREKQERQQQEAETPPAPEEPVGPFVPPGDANLMQYIEEVQDKISPLPTTRDQAMALGVFVAEKLGGPIDRGQLMNFSWELQISQLKFDIKSNVIPIGMIKFGIHYHRALLFKALADRIALGATLERGEYNRAWNVIMASDDDDSAPGAPKFPPRAYIVDLVHHPGNLMLLESPDAVSYQKI